MAEGILVRISEGRTGDEIVAQREMHVCVSNLYAYDALFQQIYRSLALQIREDELTGKLASILDESGA
jgi:hypothetical protein